MVLWCSWSNVALPKSTTLTAVLFTVRSSRFYLREKKGQLICISFSGQLMGFPIADADMLMYTKNIGLVKSLWQTLLSPSPHCMWLWSQSWQRECSLVSDLCGSVCFHAKLQRRRNRPQYYELQNWPFNTGQMETNLCIICEKTLILTWMFTYIWQPGRSGRPYDALGWWSRAGNCFLWGNQKYWEPRAQNWYTYGHDSRTSQTSAHTD